ncbi:YxeA family protein [Companilactobacillus sp. HBUAS56275]|uniref:YxeA family protein n=1 Tax=Candidatus Companilactobacillus pullicola TaxID=2838523 RepID=A0A9D2CPU4_9LACO|nr:YxeA family protein [Candidatus Companilactobacillus pullicola]
MMNKKVGISLIVALIVLIPLMAYQFWYVPNFTGDDYYTYVGDSYKEIIEKDDSGADYKEYYYKQKAYDKDGNEKLLKFNSSIGRPIKADNYLKVTYNRKYNKVLSWEKVQKRQVPRKTIEQILK